MSQPPVQDSSLWSLCATCAYERAGGPRCYFHHSKFGIGKLTTTIGNIAVRIVKEADDTASEITEELKGAIDDELNEWP